MRRLVVGMVVSTLMVAALAVPVSAGGKIMGGKLAFDFPMGPINVGCEFLVDYTASIDGSFRMIETPDGGALEVDTWAEQDTFVGPGGTLVSDWYHARVAGEYAPDRSLVWMTSTGQLMTLELPDGTIFRSAGLARWDPLASLDAALVVDRGLSGDLDSFCAALDD
jgi:hypothetical protein